MTIKLIAVYDRTPDPAAFFNHYESVHAPLVRRTPGLQRLTLNRISTDLFGGEAPYIAIAEMAYADRQSFDQAMQSAENRAVVADLMSFAKDKVRIFIAESDEQ
jgi:uncharacterized protein (TIGR02118 family)